MNIPSLMLIESPELDDETAKEMLDFLYQLINAFENQYRNQLQGHHQSIELPKPDLFEEFDDELPTF